MSLQEAGPRYETAPRGRDRVDLVVVQSGVKRQRDYLVADLCGNRALHRVDRRHGRLTGNRHRIMNQRLDPARGEVRLQIASRSISSDEQMMDVAGVELR